MSSFGKNEELSGGSSLTSAADEGVSQIDWHYVETLSQPVSDGVPKMVSPLDLSKESLPKTPELRVPVASPEYAPQSYDSETYNIRQVDLIKDPGRQKRPLDDETRFNSDKWQRLVVPTSKCDIGINHGGDGAGGSNSGQLCSPVSEQVHSGGKHSHKLGPSPLLRSGRSNHHEFTGYKFSVRIEDLGSEMTVEIKRRSS